jgi:hypothetical protein
MVYTKKINNNYWYIFLSILLIILIILISIMIYLLLNKKKEKINDNKNIIIVKEKDEKPLPSLLPVFPKDLPEYNNTEYQQIGILTSEEQDKEPIILPLFSRKISNRKDRYNYYTSTDKNNMMRLPIKFDNMNCDDEIGCREIYNNDKIIIDNIYKDRIFTATLYKVDAPKYFADKY